MSPLYQASVQPFLLEAVECRMLELTLRALKVGRWGVYGMHEPPSCHSSLPSTQLDITMSSITQAQVKEILNWVIFHTNTWSDIFLFLWAYNKDSYNDVPKYTVRAPRLVCC